MDRQGERDGCHQGGTEAYLLGDRALYMFTYDKVKEAISPDGMISDAGAVATLARSANSIPP
jgi:NitT/TauT family transport system substrate-binding protein